MPYEYDYVRDFTGGENCAASPDDLKPNQLRKAENVDLSMAGGYKRRSGISLHKTLHATERIDRLIEFEYLVTGNVVRRQLALVGGNLIDWADATLTPIATNLGSVLDYEVYKNKLYILANGRFIVYDGTTLADVTCADTDSNLTTIAKCKYIEQRGQRLFACGNPDSPNALYFSEVGRPEYWKIVNEIRAVTDDGDKLTGLYEFHGALLAFKSRSIYAWFGSDPTTDVEFVKLDVHTGTRAYRTIQQVGNAVLYLGEDGVYALLGTYKDVIVTKKISVNITPRIQQIKHTVNYHEDCSCAIFVDGKYMLSSPTVSGDGNDIVFVYFNELATAENDPWTIYTGWHISDFLRSFDGDLYSGSSIDGNVHKHADVYNDLGEAIVVRTATRPLSQGKIVHNKKYRYGYVAMEQFEGANSSIEVVAWVDYRSNYELAEVTPDESLAWDLRDWDVSYWDFVSLVTRWFTIKSKGKRLTIETMSDALDEKLVVYGYAVEYREKKPDRR